MDLVIHGVPFTDPHWFKYTWVQLMDDPSLLATHAGRGVLAPGWIKLKDLALLTGCADPKLYRAGESPAIWTTYVARAGDGLVVDVRRLLRAMPTEYAVLLDDIAHKSRIELSRGLTAHAHDLMAGPSPRHKE